MMSSTTPAVPSTTVVPASVKSAVMRTARIAAVVMGMARRGIRASRVTGRPKPHPVATLVGLPAARPEGTPKNRNHKHNNNYGNYRDEYFHRISIEYLSIILARCSVVPAILCEQLSDTIPDVTFCPPYFNTANKS